MDIASTAKQTNDLSSRETNSHSGEEKNVCNVLCDILLSGIDIHRVLAAQALGHIGGDEAINALIKALLDEDEDVRTDAATALAGLVDARADKQLLENLIGDQCAEVKLAAMTALTATRNDEVKPWLLRILAGRDEEIAWDEDEFYTTGWDDWADMQVKAMESLADLGVEDAIPGIVAAISDDDSQDITETAMKSLARIGSSGITALAGFLDDGDERRRRRAAFMISSCDGPDATSAVRRAIQDPSSDVRLAVARGLAAKNPADERLAILLLDEVPQVRAEAVRLCGCHNEDRLDLLLDDKNTDVQQAVLDLLTEHPELTNTPMLGARVRELLHSPTASLAASAAAAFAAVSPQDAVSELAEMLDGEGVSTELQRGVIKGLRTVGGDEALQALSGVLACDDRQIRLEAMSAIADLAGDADWPNAAGDTLLAALSGELVPEPEEDIEEEVETESESESINDDDAEEEKAADAGTEEAPEDEQFPTSTLDAIINGMTPEKAEPLPEDIELTPEDLDFLSLTGGDKKGRRTIPVVPDVVAHEDVRLFAARLLGNFSHPDVTLSLLAPLSSNDMELKQTAADSLAHLAANLSALPDDTLSALLAEAKSQHRDIRRQALRALGCVNDASVIMVLINALDDEDSFVRTEAIRSLGRLGEAGAGVGRLLEDTDASVRLIAAQALAETRAAGVVETLVAFSYAFEGYHGRQAAQLLAGIDKQAANSLFIKALNDEERKRYWKVAIEALDELNRSPVSTPAHVSV